MSAAMDIIWEDPPPNIPAKLRRVAALVDELHKRPSQWARDPEPATSAGTPTARAKHFPDTEWTLRRRPDGKYDVYGRSTRTAPARAPETVALPATAPTASKSSAAAVAGKVFRCGDIDCSAEHPTVQDLALHAVTEHERSLTRGERTPVTPDSARTGS